MEEMLIINPRGRRNARGQFTKRRRNPKRRRRHVNARRRRRNPIAAVAVNPRRRRRRNPIALAVNPRRRRRRNPILAMNPRRRRYRHRNPSISGITSSFKPRAILAVLIPAGVGAGGALALDIAMSYVPLPATMQTPMAKNIARIIGAIALGALGTAFLGRQKGAQVALGALTVVSYNVLREFAVQQFPTLTLSGITQGDYSDLNLAGRRLGYINPAPMLTSGMGAYMGAGLPPVPGMGAYMGRGGLDNVNSLSGVVSDGL